MKKNDLKQLIKPLVKECILEVLIEEGLLSNVVSEVAKGMQGNLMVESAPVRPIRKEEPRPPSMRNGAEAKKKIREHRKKLLGAIDADAYNGVDLFEGTEPMTSQGASPPHGGPDLGNPSDSGVDISSLVGGASKIWKAMK
jgi:hypothetical protein|tara:strand:+ start:1692 stop:2114 length:423 start_codon:yes stop_codon:yes gene_type:complete